MSRKLVIWHLSYEWLDRLLRVGLPMVPAAAGGWIIAYANRYFLLYFHSDAAAVGLLEVGGKVSAPLVLFTSAFRIAWGPFAFSIQKQENARFVYAKTLTHFAVLSGSVAIAISLFAREVLMIFTTPRYVDGYTVSGLMAFQIIADTAYYIVSIGLMLAKQTKALAYSVPLAAAASIAFNLMLVPTFGFFGAALATTLSYSLSTLFAYILAQRAFMIPYETFKLARLGLLCVGFWIFSIVLIINGFWLAIVVKLLICIVFLLGLLLLRIVGIGEIKLLLNWLYVRLLAFIKK